MNGISDDVLNVNYGNGDSGSRRPRLYGDESHQLDTLNVSNSSSRNGSNWFFAFITSLNIMVKNFAKIAKAFVGLSVAIVTRKRNHILIIHLEEKYAKIDCKNENYMKN